MVPGGKRQATGLVERLEQREKEGSRNPNYRDANVGERKENPDLHPGAEKD